MSSRPTPGRATAELPAKPPPLTYALPVWESGTPLRPRSTPQLVAGLAMYLGAIWLAFADVPFRHFEALLATPVTGLVTGGKGAVTSHDIVFFALGTNRAFGLKITEECTSALLLIPLLVMMGSFTVFSRLPLRRDLVALVVGAGLMMFVNMLRVALIGFSTYHWGMDPGYRYSHVFVGSAFSLIGFVGAMLLAMWVLVRTERAGHPPVAAAPEASASTDGEPGPVAPDPAAQAPVVGRRRRNG